MVGAEHAPHGGSPDRALTERWTLIQLPGDARRAGACRSAALGRIDAARGVASWDEALGFLVELPGTIDEVQYWGHGTWGCALVDRDVLDEAALTRAHPLHARLAALRNRMAPGGLLWFRTCETFGARRGMVRATQRSLP